MRLETVMRYVFLLIAVGIALSGCATKQPTVIDTGDIRQLRHDYQQLMDEYNRLKQDYQRLTERSQYYADYYQNATERITAGADELAEIGRSSADEITKLRTNLAILRKIILGIVDGQQGEGQQNTETDGNKQ